MNRVFLYSFAQARVRAMKGKLLSPEDWHYLLRMKSLDDILKYLNGTDYATVLAGFPVSGLESGFVSLALYGGLFADYSRILKAVPATGAHLVRSLLLRYEAENLKTIFRGIWQDRTASETRSLLYGLGALSRLPVEELLEARQISDAIDLSKATPFYPSLLHAWPQFQAQGRLFPLETAVDAASFDPICERSSRMRGIDRRRTGDLIGDLIGELIDMLNLSWLVRFRHFYGLSAEETINYTLPGGRRMGIRDLGTAARAHDVSSFLAALPHPYREALGRVGQWAQIQTLLGRRFVSELYRAFSQDPFQISLPVSYLFLKEMEVKSLGSLLSAVELSEPTERLMDFISLPLKGGVRV